jgi:hypothetical protein
MTDYVEWSNLEREFREIHERHPNLYALWNSLDRKWTGFGGLDDDEDRFHSLCGIAATMDGCTSPKRATAHWLNSVKAFLLRRKSGNLKIGHHARYVKPGTPIGRGATWSDPDVEHGKTYKIRSLCRVLADFCLERARQSLPRLPKSGRKTPASLAKIREAALQSFVRDHRTSIAAVGRAARVDKKNLQEWRKGKLSDDSVMAARIEDVLKGKIPLLPSDVEILEEN